MLKTKTKQVRTTKAYEAFVRSAAGTFPVVRELSLDPLPDARCISCFTPLALPICKVFRGNDVSAPMLFKVILIS